MSATSRRSGGPGILAAETIVLWTVLAIIVVVGGTITGAAQLGARISGVDAAELPGNPFELLIGLAAGDVAWPPAATGALIAIVAALAALAGAVTAVMTRRGPRPRVDRAAAKMGRGRELAALTAKGAAATAARLGVKAAAPGVAVGRAIAGGHTLYGSWEDMIVDISGTRSGKTTSRAVPAILDGPGAVFATSNKRDLVDATRDPRAEHGEVWVFDPQALAGEEPDWWWNPLSYVTDETRAAILADVFVAASRSPEARTDAYFDTAGPGLLAGLLLAAAVGQRPITQVWLWLTNPTDDEPVAILRDHDYPLPAADVADVVNAPEKQRAGVYGTAKQSVSFLLNRQATRWITPPPPGESRREFDPHAFVRTGDTLYSLSKEGRGTYGPVVTALTVAVTEAAEDLAKRSPGGRLRTPMVGVLDEAANICRWPELPNLYSHYGSRGICLMTILQSWSQGVEVWGRHGMRKLWSAANIRLYGGGVAEPDFLNELSQLIGPYNLNTTAVTYGRGGRNVQHSTRPEQILDIADLGALPKTRAVVFPAGARPALIRTLPWMAGPHADAVKASILAHDPAPADTLDDAAEELTDTLDADPPTTGGLT